MNEWLLPLRDSWLGDLAPGEWLEVEWLARGERLLMLRSERRLLTAYGEQLI